MNKLGEYSFPSLGCLHMIFFHTSMNETTRKLLYINGFQSLPRHNTSQWPIHSMCTRYFITIFFYNKEINYYLSLLYFLIIFFMHFRLEKMTEMFQKLGKKSRENYQHWPQPPVIGKFSATRECHF